MRKIWNFLIILVAMILLASCTCVNKSAPVHKLKTVEVITPKQSINNIAVQGFCNLTIKTGAKKQMIELKGNAYALKKTRVNIKHGNLYINCHSNLPLSIQIYTYQLEKIILTNSGNIKLKALTPSVASIYTKDTGKINLQGRWTIPTLSINGKGDFFVKGHIRIGELDFSGSGILMLKTLYDQKKLTINKSGTGHVILRGYANLTNINEEGSGSVDLYWTNSQSTTINAKEEGQIKLAGKTKVLTANLQDQAKLNARYLRAKDIFIKTHDNAFAAIHPLDQLFAYAMNHSQINYYGAPKKVYRHPIQEGVILPLSE